MEKITVEVIAHKEFTISSKGYNQTEVDNFLDDICEELERMDKEIAELRQKTTAVYQAPAAPAASGVTEEQEQSFREVLESAVQVKNDTIRKAREDAAKEVAELKAVATEYRAKFEVLLQAQQEALEKATGLFEEQ